MAMQVANRSNVLIKTERQWNQEGYKLLETAVGERMWTNQHCGQIATYYSKAEVVEMSETEQAAWSESERKRKNERARITRKARIQKQKEWEEQCRQEELAREKEWENWKAACKDKLEEQKQTQNKLAVVYIEDYDSFIYEVPAGIEPNTVGLFPYGCMNELYRGTVMHFIEPECLTKEAWFPYGLKKMHSVIEDKK